MKSAENTWRRVTGREGGKKRRGKGKKRHVCSAASFADVNWKPIGTSMKTEKKKKGGREMSFVTYTFVALPRGLRVPKRGKKKKKEEKRGGVLTKEPSAIAVANAVAGASAASPDHIFGKKMERRRGRALFFLYVSRRTRVRRGPEDKTKRRGRKKKGEGE